jgi:hypothetical protein
MPIMPPSAESAIASTKNYVNTSLPRAPIAKRTPISRVRSVTETSMMALALAEWSARASLLPHKPAAQEAL